MMSNIKYTIPALFQETLKSLPTTHRLFMRANPITPIAKWAKML